MYYHPTGRMGMQSKIRKQPRAGTSATLHLRWVDEESPYTLI